MSTWEPSKQKEDSSTDDRKCERCGRRLDRVSYYSNNKLLCYPCFCLLVSNDE